MAVTKGAAFEIPLDRRLGSFYTPDDVATVLACWAIADKNARVLDPSFGGCSFLRAANAELVQRGAHNAGQNIYGVDVDRRALKYAQDLFDDGVPQRNIVLRDFFDVTPQDVGGSFDAILGNPPYVRHHWFRGASRQLASAIAARAGVDLDGRSSAWAYFIVHSVNFLKLGGRMAQLLPGAVLQADYAPAVLTFLQARFQSVRLIRVAQRLFPNAQEETVVLLASGYGRRATGEVSVTQATDVESLARRISSSDRGGVPANGSWRLASLTAEQHDAWFAFKEARAVTELSNLCTVKIGTVTGANDFFLRSSKEATALGLARSETASTVPNQKYFRRIEWSAADLRATARSGARTRLILLKEEPRGPGARRLIAEGERAGLHLRTKCKGREPWHVLGDVDPPDFFLPYMSARTPRIVVNSAGSSCLNSIHRLFCPDSDLSRVGIAIASLTAGFALGAEIYGRTYGGGVLKLEPSDARRVPIANIDVPARRRAEIDRALTARDWTSARVLADQAVLVDGMGMRKRDVKALRNAVHALASRR